MKRILFILKDLQNSGQDATIVGHFTLQVGNFQDVTNIDNVREQPRTALSETDDGKNSNRYTTEQEQNADRMPSGLSIIPYVDELPPDLVQIVAVWPDLPEVVKKGMIAMSEAIAPSI